MLEAGQKDEKEDSFALRMKTPKEISVLIAVQKPIAIWEIGMEDVPQKADIATIQYYIVHIIYHMNGTQVMSATSNHDFNTEPYVKAPRSR